MGMEDKGGGVLDDLASHQIDLLCWMFHEQVQAVKKERLINTSMGKDVIKYELRFGNVCVVECIAGHGNYYREYLELEWNEKRFWSTRPVFQRFNIDRIDGFTNYAMQGLLCIG